LMPTTHSLDRMSRARGFSLVELCLVLTVMGIMLGFSLPAFQAFRVSSALPGASREMIGQFKLARQMAIARSSTYGIRVDLANKRFQSYDPSSPTNNRWTALDRTVSIASVNAPAAGGLFTFDYNGRLSTGG